MRTARLEIVEGLEAVDARQRLGQDGERELGHGLRGRGVVFEELRGSRGEHISMCENEKGKRRQTFLINKRPMKACGRPGSCTGNREYPDMRLGGRTSRVSRLRPPAAEPNVLHLIHLLVIEDVVRREGDDVLDRRHDLLDVLVVQLEHAVQDRDLVVAEGLLALAVELEEALELGLLVRRRLVRAEDGVEELRDRVRDGREEVHEEEHGGRAPGPDGEAVPDGDGLGDDPVVGICQSIGLFPIKILNDGTYSPNMTGKHG
jgi:hypothetical protein